jgi:hypothetical protein
MNISRALRDEIRKVMAIHGLWKIYRKSQMKQKDIHIFLEDIFHGNTKLNIVSQVTQVVKGLAPFDRLYTTQTDQVVCANVDASSNGTSLVLKSDLSRSETIIIAGRDITQTVLERTTFTKPLLMKGRKLFTDANVALKNIRKALGVLKNIPGVTFVDDELQYASGLSEEDIKERLLDAMHQLLNGKTSVEDKSDVSDLVADEEEENNDPSSTETNTESNDEPVGVVLVRPPGWFFQGWMAFVLFGPFAEPAYRLDLFTIGTHPDDGKAALSRKALRKAAAEIKDEQRLANINKRSDDCTRGISQVTQANMEMRNKEIRIREQEMSNNEREGIMLNLHIQLNSLNRVLERAEVRASNCTTNFDSNHYLWQKVIQVENEIDEINMKMKYIMEKTTAGECPPKRARVDDSTTFRDGDNMTVATGK